MSSLAHAITSVSTEIDFLIRQLKYCQRGVGGEYDCAQKQMTCRALIALSSIGPCLAVPPASMKEISFWI